MEFVMRDLDARAAYRLMTSCIVPRPIAWVTTESAAGVYNAAPFSFFTGVSIQPPLVLFAVERRAGKKKDTLVNIEETGEFVINLVTMSNVVQMNLTSQDFPPDLDELLEAELTPIPSRSVKPPSIKESPVHMECRLVKIFEIGSSPHSVVIGEVEQITINDAMMEDGHVRMDRLGAVGRMGGKWYVRAESLFQLPRLDWRKNEIGS